MGCFLELHGVLVCDHAEDGFRKQRTADRWQPRMLEVCELYYHGEIGVRIERNHGSGGGVRRIPRVAARRRTHIVVPGRPPKRKQPVD